MWRVRERWSSGLPVGEAWISKLQDLAMYIVWLQEFQVSSFSVQTTRDFTKPFDKPSKRGYSKSRLIGVVQGWFRISAAGLIGTGVSTSKVCCYKPLYRALAVSFWENGGDYVQRRLVVISSYNF